MDNESGRAALREIDGVFHQYLEIVKKELNDTHEKNRTKDLIIKSKDEQIASDREFIKSLQAQIKILNIESYELKAERDIDRGIINFEKSKSRNFSIISIGTWIVIAVIAIVVDWFIKS